jgi:hypothetical protein
MKKLFISLLLAGATLPVLAQHHGVRHHGHHGHYRGPGIGWWVAPVVVGAIGYELGRQQTVVIQQPPIIVQQPIGVQNQNCTPWTETQQSDGTIVRTRTCTN